MKISKTAVLAMGCVFTAAGLGLTVATAVAGNENEKTLNVDLKNAVQHIEEVVFISSGSSNSPEAIAKQVGDRLVGIKTDRFVLSKDENSNKITTSVGSKGKGSSILGGISNKMKGGAYNVILAGSGNEMKRGTDNTILGGERNQTNGETTNTSWSTIIGGKDNTIEGNHSVTVGGHDNSIKGNKSTIVGNNSSVTGNNSTALGLNSKINASGSFLWTDGEEYGELIADNVFAVMSRSGMVINTKKAHPLAQLTIGNPMIVYESKKSEGIKCGDNQGGGIMKVVKNGGNANQVCFCSCDGSGWNSLFGGRGACQSYCQGTTHKEPKCGGFVQYKASTNDKKRFSGSCEVGEVLEGTGAYLVTSDGKIHWSCQTEDGSVTPCSGQIGSEENSWQPYQYHCIGEFENANLVNGIGNNPDNNVDSTLYKTLSEAEGNKCSYVCDDGYKKEGNECVKDEHATPGVCTGGDVPGTDNIRKGSEEPSDNEEWKYIPNTNAVLGACEWTCINDNYERVVGQNYCQPKQTVNNDPECGANAKTHYFALKKTTKNWGLHETRYCLAGNYDETSLKLDGNNLTWNCTGNSATKKCTAYQQRCGDGKENGSEECDLGEDMNGSDGAGCDNTCKQKTSCGKGAGTTQYFTEKQRSSWLSNDDLCGDNFQPGYRITVTGTDSHLEWNCVRKTGNHFEVICKAYQQRCGDGITNDDDEDCDDGTNNGKVGFCPSTCKRFNCITPRNFNQNLYPPYDIPFTFVNRGSIQSDTYVSVCADRASAQNQNCSYICADSNLIPIVGNNEVRSGCKTLKSTDRNVRCDTQAYSCTKAECGALHMQTITEIPWNAEYCRDSSNQTTASPTGTGWTWTCKCSSTNTTATCWANKGNINPCEGKTYTISYSCNGGSGNPQSQTITYGAGGKITNSKCTKNGDTFIGWASTSSATRPEWYPGQDMDGELITSCNDKTLYAVYASSSDFRCGNATQVSHTSQPTTDLCYGGLSTTGAYKGSDNLWHWNCRLIVSGIERINIPCKDQPSNQCKRKVTFDGNGGTANPTSKEVSCGSGTTLASASRNGYTFDGWYTSKTGGTKAGNALDSYTPNGDVTLYAHWTQNQCKRKVTFDGNGGTANPTSKDVSCGNQTTLANASRADYTFDGWYTSKTGGTKVGNALDSYTPNGDVTLYAHWTQNQCKRKVTFDGNGGTANPTSKDVSCGNQTTLANASRADYTFDGWYTSKTGGTKVGNALDSYTPNGDVTLYAHWTQNQCKRKVTFDGNGGTANPTSKEVSCGSGTTLASASRNGYTFDGWYTSKTGGTKAGNALDSYTPNGDVTLYAHWTQKSCSATTHTYGNCSYEILALSNGGSQTVINNKADYTGSTTATCTNGNLSYSDETCREIENGQCENSEPYGCKNNSNTVIKEDTTSDSSWKWYCKGLDGRSPLCTKSCPSGYELIWNGTHNGFCAQKVTSPSCPSNKWKLNWNNIEGCGNTPWWNNDPEAWRYTSNFTNYNTCMDAGGLYGNNSRAYIINAYGGRIPCYSCDCVKDSSAGGFTQLDQDQSSCKLNEAENCRTLYAYLDLTEYKEDACKNDETHWICRQSNNSWITCTNSSSAQQKIPCLVWK